MKKLFALLLALTMVFSLATVTSAVTITIEDTTKDTLTDNHVFSVYQIFTGDIADGKLSNLKCGANFGTAGETVTDENLFTYGLVTRDGNDTDGYTYTVADSAAARAFAEELKDADGSYDLTGSAIATLNKDNNWTVSKIGEEDLPAGYYLIVDTSTNLSEGYTKSQYILEVRDSATITMKAEKPESNKKVKDKNDTDGTSTDWQDSADHDVGDNVEFKIEFKLPGDYANYDDYAVTVHDHQSAGLTFIPDTVDVTVNGVSVKEWFNVIVNPAKTDKCGNTACSFHITCEDIKAKDQADSNVTLTAGTTIVFTYSSTLNDDAVLGSNGNPNEMHVEFSNNPEGEGTNNTVEDKVIVFTYEPIVNKVDEKNDPLQGAEFTLFKKVKDTAVAEGFTWVQVQSAITVTDATTTFGFKGIDDGEYKLVETKTPAGYNTIEDIYFTVSAEHSVEAATPVLINLNVTSNDATFATDMATGKTTGNINTTIVNKAGTSLPETGGMGTTLFYIVGGIMVAAAVVLLVTKKRMGAEA